MSNPLIGNHNVRAVDLAMCRSDSGSNYVGGVFIVFDDAGAEIGRVTGSLFLTEKTTERTAKALQALGWDGVVAEDGSMRAPKVAPASIVEEEFKGRFYTKIDWIGEPPFGVEIKSKDRLTLSQAKSQVADLQKLCGVGDAAGKPAF